MSNRTIVEFNHDYWGEIVDDPSGFVEAIRRMLNSGSEANGVRDGLRRYGVQVAPTAHHTDQREVDFGGSMNRWRFG